MASPYGPMFPSTAYYLSLVGGILIALDGLVAAAEAAVFSSTLNSIVPGLTGVVIIFGIVGFIFGLLIIFLALRLKRDPTKAKSTGVIIVVLALLSIFGGGGFYFIGLLLALIGGVLAVVWTPRVQPQSPYSPAGYALPTDRPSATTQWGAPASPPTQAGVTQRFCSSCGSPNLVSAQFCAKCGAPMQ